MQSNDRALLRRLKELAPDAVIDSAEAALGVPMTGLCRALNSYINRVFELRAQSGEGIVAKFYRPGRWSRTALEDEHEFLFELAEREIPVIPPLRLASGGSLGEFDGVYFALYPKKLGRGLDEPSDETWEELGRLIARVHLVGATRRPNDRITLSPLKSTRANVEYIVSSGLLPNEVRSEYLDVTSRLIEMIAPMFDDVESIRIHGDCHRGNIVYRPGESHYLIDFDDMAVGPPVHDFWMLLPDLSHQSRMEIELFLEGYTTFRPFDRRSLRLIEPLRAMRYIYFSSWHAMQAVDGEVPRLAPDIAQPSYWRREIGDLRTQIEEIKDSREINWSWG